VAWVTGWTFRMTETFVFPRRPASLAFRVTWLVGMAMTVVFLIFNWISIRSLDQHFAEMDEEELEVISGSVVQALAQVSDGSYAQRLHGAVRGHHGVYYYVADAAGNALYAMSEGPDLARFAASQVPIDLEARRDMTVWAENGTHFRGAVVQVDSSTNPGSEVYTIAVAMDIGGHLAFMRSFKRIQWWTIGVVTCIALLVAWLAVRWGHIPIHRANEKIRAITSAELHMRLNPKDVPVELEETVASFNEMLGRIEEGFRQLADYSADIAHELRTPLTNLTTQTEVALGQSRSAEEYREILYSDLEEFRRLKRMINDMLFLAQTENEPGSLSLERVNLDDAIRGLFEYFEAWAEERGVSLELRGGAAPIRAHRELLRRALSNLLSNAIRHAPRGTVVAVGLAQEARSTVVSVENTGSKIAKEDLPRIFDRFYRAGASGNGRSEGAGLGLAIVRSIVEVHGGGIEVVSNDSVTRFRIVLLNASS
jgi:two-component system, OmpR family, heavy metal sensor histidine kinase CusS